MGNDIEQQLAVRAELARLVDGLRGTSFDRQPVACLGEIDRLRMTARRTGFEAVADCAVAMERALVGAMARGDGAFIMRGWLDVMDDAIGCARADPATTQALIASVALRLHG